LKSFTCRPPATSPGMPKAGRNLVFSNFTSSRKSTKSADSEDRESEAIADPDLVLVPALALVPAHATHGMIPDRVLVPAPDRALGVPALRALAHAPGLDHAPVPATDPKRGRATPPTAKTANLVLDAARDRALDHALPVHRGRRRRRSKTSAVDPRHRRDATTASLRHLAPAPPPLPPRPPKSHR